ncbi:ABC transporter permease [Sphingomonas gilva]|uniref:ABC transporter permease n=1 Tax=Sphingomonas gilva TaxID=2305907 RepID=A0A396RR25_9SPHN|nr:ABC transporter permease [Sphingomonas gilva]RHW19084.1 ABC transporter permease [Sphingomonas gilva]
MWRNYLTVGLRALAKNRTYAFINIVGLAIGLAACLLILLYVRYEHSYDGWMKDADQAFQLQSYHSADDLGGEEQNLQLSAIVAARALAKDFPQVENVVFVRSFSPVIIQDGQASQIDDLRMVVGNLFDILQVPFVRGDPRTALGDSHSLVLSESEAKRRFGDADPIGKTLTIVDNAGDVDYRVTGVFRDIPKNSSFSASMVARFDPEVQFADRVQVMTRWDSQQGWNYVKLRKGADADAINAQLAAWEKRNIPDQVVNGEVTNSGDTQDFGLVNIRDVHLGKAQQYGMTPGNDRTTVVTFAVIALLVLGMACVNFTNLATARASQRAREVALRKVLGATRRQLIAQFMGESILLAAIAMVAALTLVELTLPAFNAFLDADIALGYFGADGIWLPAVVLVLLVGVAGGLYPAFYLSRFQPGAILKANRSAADTQGSGRLRNALVVLQFSISIGLIVCTSVIYAQTLHARTLDAGYRRDGLLQVKNLTFKGVSPAQSQALVERIRRLPGVEAAARTQIAISPDGNSTADYFLPGSASSIALGTYGVETGFFKAMGMKLLAGRVFSDAQGKDDATTPYPVDLAAERALAVRGINVVITETAAARLGFDSPQEAIGKQMRGTLTVPEVGLIPCTIVGVVSDARFRSLREPIQPIVYVMQKVGFAQIAVRYAGAAPSEVRERIRRVWDEVVPLVPFEADFADDLVRGQYEREIARGQLFAAFAVLTVVIGCLGLFGLAAFTAERRTKEIGIRKVLGARTRDIVRLLVWQFSRPVLIANLIAWPVAWWVMRDWLNGFDTRIALTPTPFVAAGLLALIVALATIASHALRVARTNPVHALRYE